MSNILVEVDEAMKQERLERLWKRYGGFFIGFLAIIILGTAINAGYGSWVKSKNIKQTDILLSVITKETYGVEDLDAITKDLTGGLHDIAQISASGLLIKQDKVDEAIVRYKALAEKSNKNIAQQLSEYMAINLSQDLSAEEKLSKLNAIASKENNPFRYQALIDSALIEANITNNYTKARSHLSAIINQEDAPKSIRQKAQSLDILYALKEKTSTTKQP